ncbi:E3 SUMO-protein ligase ZBED1-like [Mercenaria mercenaria]|uniref:E3 SUMO-protein ligase ZBED1-like n=1 Tax=Mercenaria mercenaria TaxID=6596 RepID=UPI001E1DBA2C|nr:E3 SUMO-protein ligase ZBED1-like [Mercenaria mercenaria]
MRRKRRDILLDVVGNKAKQEIAASDQTPVTEYLKGKTKYSASDPRQTLITNALVSYIAGDLVPLSVVDSQYFKNLMEKADPKYQVPIRKHLTSKLIHGKCAELKNDIKFQLKSAQSVCLTLDLWTNRQMRAFLGVTGHFIQEWQLKSVMLACSRF